MEFRTPIDLPKHAEPINPQDQVLFAGSCFAENIGSEMAAHKFTCAVNPFGVLYNPASIRLCFEEVREEFPVGDFLFEANGSWHSWLHDSTFSRSTREECLSHLCQSLDTVREELRRCHTLFLTFGTNHAYRLKESGVVVGNCHKQPGRLFEEIQLDTDRCAEEIRATIALCRQWNPQMRFVLTVSPYRYAKYGFHGNQLSKATLLLALDEVCRTEAGCLYFPAYEIVLDELRDYRFYKEDMLHPSAQAVAYIWECFQKTFFTPATQTFIREWEEIRRALEHRPLHPESEAYKVFLSKTLLKLVSIRKKYPNLALSYEFDWLSTRLK